MYIGFVVSLFISIIAKSNIRKVTYNMKTAGETGQNRQINGVNEYKRAAYE